MPILEMCHLRPSGLAAASKFPRVVRTGAVAEGWAAATHAACWVVWLVMGAGSLVLGIGERPSRYCSRYCSKKDRARPNIRKISVSGGCRALEAVHMEGKDPSLPAC